MVVFTHLIARRTINSILWGNQAPSGSQIYNQGSYITIDYSVVQNNCSGIGSAGGCFQTCNSIFTSDPLLGMLQNNRGYTETMLPAIGSSAIDSGDNLNCTSEDQRGVVTPQNGQCDIGSVEILNACRVTTNGTNVGNGSDWSGQSMSLQTALTTPSCREVWIKAGTYKPTTGSNRSLSFNVLPGVAILGGFAGTENTPNDRDVSANTVILSGNIGNQTDMTDNSFHVISLDGTQGTKILASTYISDLEIHDGFSSLNVFDFPNNSGAGIFCNGSGSNSACKPYLNNIRFYNNQAMGGSGGGMFNHAQNNGESSPSLVNVIFDSNNAVNGGAIYNYGKTQGNSSPIIISTQFLNNTASSSGGAVYNGAYDGGTSRSQFLFNHFANNNAAYGGAVYCDEETFGINTASFTQSSFINNDASVDGGAIYSAGWNEGMSKPSIQDTTFESNSAVRGGAIFLNDLAGNGSAELNRVTFTINDATDGGAIYNNGDNGASNPAITNSTFSGNSASYGGAIYSSAEFSGLSSAILRHVIMWGNTASNSGDTIYHNLAESNVYDSILEFGCPNFGAGNTNCNNIITSNPLLGALSDNGGHTDTLMPANNSPAIDAGDNTSCPDEDQRGEYRYKGLACDIGSVEVNSQGTTDVIFNNGFE